MGLSGIIPITVGKANPAAEYLRKALRVNLADSRMSFSLAIEVPSSDLRVTNS
jgi:hypothetical protein